MALFDWFRNAATAAEADISSVAPAERELARVEGLDFADVLIAHQRWKVRLNRCIAGTSDERLDPAIVCRDDHCVLGKWINGPGAEKFGRVPVFSELRTAHTQFHFIAGEVLWAAQNGETGEAQNKLETTFSRSSAMVQKHLASLFLAVSK